MRFSITPAKVLPEFNFSNKTLIQFTGLQLMKTDSILLIIN